MQKKIKILTDAIFKVFETMFFLFPEHWEGPIGSRDWIVYSITIESNGNMEKMFFYYPKELASEMASVFLGQNESDVTDDYIEESLKECTNMLGGNYLNILENDSKLGIPSKEQYKDCVIPEDLLNQEVFLVFSLNEHPFVVKISQ